MSGPGQQVHTLKTNRFFWDEKELSFLKLHVLGRLRDNNNSFLHAHGWQTAKTSTILPRRAAFHNAGR
jgi:hypothetical protein